MKYLFIILSVIFILGCKDKKEEITPIKKEDCPYHLSIKSPTYKNTTVEMCRQDLKIYSGYYSKDIILGKDENSISFTYYFNNIDYIEIKGYDLKIGEKVYQTNVETRIKENGIYYSNIIDINKEIYNPNSYILLEEHKYNDYMKGKYYFELSNIDNNRDILVIEGDFKVNVSE